MGDLNVQINKESISNVISLGKHILAIGEVQEVKVCFIKIL